MHEVHLNAPLFFERVQKLRNGVNGQLMVLLGKVADCGDFNMNSALFHYLLGYEFPETLLILSDPPIVITSPKKALILRQISPLQVLVRNKDGSNFDELLQKLSGKYAVADSENCRGEFCKTILSRLSHTDETSRILEVLSVKEPSEVLAIQRCAVASSYLLQKGINLLREMEFSKDSLENYMNDNIKEIDAEYLEYSFDPEYSFDLATKKNHLRLGIRYRVYCTEIARPFLSDVSSYYDTQRYATTIISPGKNSAEVLRDVEKYIQDKQYPHTANMYTIGLLDRERDFRDSFTLQKSMCFVINIDGRFANTFLLESLPVQLTKRDQAEDYTESRMRFRNKTNDANIQREIKEHQRALLDELLEERRLFYSENRDKKSFSDAKVQKIIKYEKDSQVPRSEEVFLDWERMYVLVPILSYSVPFHISTIKNVSVSGAGSDTRLRLNFKTSKEVSRAEDDAANSGSGYDTTLKSLSVRARCPEELVGKINDMRKEFSKPWISVKKQGALKESKRVHALLDVYSRGDQKSSNKKITGNLEIHENGLKYRSDIEILFSNIKNAYFAAGNEGRRTLLHFNLFEPVVLCGKPSYNVQFFAQFTMSFHDTGRRENDRMEIARQEEEEEKLARTNSEFAEFVAVFERISNIRVQIPETGFLGVHSKEAVNVAVTSECLVAIEEQPFFVLNFSEVEVVNFERVTPVTKTFDAVFVFKDKTKPVAMLGSIEMTNLSYFKELIDSHNIVFMETTVNINWPNVIQKILEDPLGFYESDGWSELLRVDDDDETVSDEEKDTDDETVDSTDTEDDTDDDGDETLSGESESVSSEAENESAMSEEDDVSKGEDDGHQTESDDLIVSDSTDDEESGEGKRRRRK